MIKRYLGLDVGDRTIGIAVSDALGLTAQGVETIRRTSLKDDLARLKTLMDEYETTSLVIGLPKNMDGTEGERCELSRAFAKMLEEKFDLPVDMYDERLTTVSADRTMKETGLSDHADRKKYVDEIAAMLILQGYMDRLSNEVK